VLAESALAPVKQIPAPEGANALAANGETNAGYLAELG
jgi:hypothetical protein